MEIAFSWRSTYLHIAQDFHDHRLWHLIEMLREHDREYQEDAHPRLPFLADFCLTALHSRRHGAVGGLVRADDEAAERIDGDTHETRTRENQFGRLFSAGAVSR